MFEFRCIEFNAIFPRDSILTLVVMDYDMLSKDDLIGETRIDLENRLFAREYASCGLQQTYETYPLLRSSTLISNFSVKFLLESTIDVYCVQVRVQQMARQSATDAAVIGVV